MEEILKNKNVTELKRFTTEKSVEELRSVRVDDIWCKIFDCFDMDDQGVDIVSRQIIKTLDVEKLAKAFGTNCLEYSIIEQFLNDSD